MKEGLDKQNCSVTNEFIAISCSGCFPDINPDANMNEPNRLLNMLLGASKTF